MDILRLSWLVDKVAGSYTQSSSNCLVWHFHSESAATGMRHWFRSWNRTLTAQKSSALPFSSSSRCFCLRNSGPKFETKSSSKFNLVTSMCGGPTFRICLRTLTKRLVISDHRSFQRWCANLIEVLCCYQASWISIVWLSSIIIRKWRLPIRSWKDEGCSGNCIDRV